MDILNMLGLGGSQTQQMGEQLGVAPQQMSAALEAAVPLLLGQLGQNATNPQQAQALSAAVEQHDGSALDNFQAGQLPDMQEGQNILGHVFGGQQENAAYAVAQRAGINPQTAMQILALLAPLVMGYLGRNRGAGAGGLGSVLGGNLGGLGSILGSVLGGGGLGGMLGGMLGGGQAQAQQYQQPQYPQPQQQEGGLGGMLGSVLGGGGLGSVLGEVLGGAQQQAQPQQAQPQYQDDNGIGNVGGIGGVGLEPVQQQAQQQPQQGGVFGAVNEVLGGNHGALDDLIGMFGGSRNS